jgi:uncharacterized NAD(P)/FAD-binding protein YdhS
MRKEAIIIGGGASGALMAVHLLRAADRHLHVTLIEKSPRIGRGIAYGTANPAHLLNVPAGSMSAIDSEPDHFCDWLGARADRPSTLAHVDQIRSAFVPRALYGEYLASLLASYAARGNTPGRLSIVHGECVSIDESRSGVTVTLASGARHFAELAAIATGHDLPPARGGCYVDSWTAPADAGVERDHRVLVIGTGLTMVDYVLALESAGHQGQVVAISRRGLLPLPHRPAAPLPLRHAEIPLGANASALLKWLRARAADHEAQGGNWRSTVDGIRIFNQDIWRRLPPSARKSFMRHARAWWNVHRHRLAPEIENRMAAALRSGRLTIIAAKVSAIEPRSEGAYIRYRRRGAPAIETMEADKIVDCRGVVSVPYRPVNPALRDLIARGRARLDALQIGLDVAHDGAIVDRSGRKSQRLFAIGPMARAALWEITSVPEIRRQCAEVASRVNGLYLRNAG